MIDDAEAHKASDWRNRYREIGYNLTKHTMHSSTTKTTSVSAVTERVKRLPTGHPQQVVGAQQIEPTHNPVWPPSLAIVKYPFWHSSQLQFSALHLKSSWCMANHDGCCRTPRRTYHRASHREFCDEPDLSSASFAPGIPLSLIANCPMPAVSDSERATTHRRAGAPPPTEPTSYRDSALVVFALLLAFRIVNALTLRTFFQPDEFFQSLEPAWQLAFGESSNAWITWVNAPLDHLDVHVVGCLSHPK